MVEMEEKFKNLPLRNGVGIVVLNKQNKVLLILRAIRFVHLLVDLFFRMSVFSFCSFAQPTHQFLIVQCGWFRRHGVLVSCCSTFLFDMFGSWNNRKLKPHAAEASSATSPAAASTATSTTSTSAAAVTGLT